MSLYEVDFPFTIRTVSPDGKPGPLVHKLLRVELNSPSLDDLHHIVRHMTRLGATHGSIGATARKGK